MLDAKEEDFDFERDEFDFFGLGLLYCQKPIADE